MSPRSLAEKSPASVDPVEFRQAMARWPTGVSVVTTRAKGTDFGLTVNAFLSVSLLPPTVLISLTQDADTTPAIRDAGRFAVNVLAHDQRPLSERFAQNVAARQKFEGVALHRGLEDLPLLDGTIVAIECRLEREVPLADHVLMVGSVARLSVGRTEEPLVFYRSGYGERTGASTIRLPVARG